MQQLTGQVQNHAMHAVARTAAGTVRAMGRVQPAGVRAAANVDEISDMTRNALARINEAQIVNFETMQATCKVQAELNVALQQAVDLARQRQEIDARHVETLGRQLDKEVQLAAAVRARLAEQQKLNEQLEKTIELEAKRARTSV
jgi:hypothetical protein